MGSQPLPVIRNAAERLSDRIRRADPNLPEPEALAEELENVVGLVEAGVAADAISPEPGADPSLLGLRLLDLLRSEVVESWSDPGSQESPSPDLHAVMRAFEAVRRHLSPEDPELLGAPVLDPWARRLLGEMAHTLGSSMGSMVMLTEVLASGESGEVNELQRSQLRILYRAALGTGSMAQDLLRLAGPFEEPEEGVSGIFAIPEALEEVASVLGPLLEERGVEAAIGLADDGGGDGPRVGRAFALRRALLALSLASMTDRSGGTFTLTARADGNRVRFEVAREPLDDSDGPPDAVREIFRERQGRRGWHISPSALGLSAARQLVRSLGAELSVDSLGGAGVRASFSVELPPVAEE